MHEELLRMYLCTKDLQAEREIAHLKAPEGIRQDYNSVAKQLNVLTGAVKKLQGEGGALKLETNLDPTIIMGLRLLPEEEVIPGQTEAQGMHK